MSMFWRVACGRGSLLVSGAEGSGASAGGRMAEALVDGLSRALVHGAFHRRQRHPNVLVRARQQLQLTLCQHTS